MKKLFALLMIAALACAGAALAEGPLPAYTYTGSDAVEGAVAAYIVSDMSENIASEEGCVTIPAPVILKVEQIDDSHVKVYGDFWGFNYVLDGKVLETISGGEAPGIMTLEKSGDAWTVTAVETAGDGTDFAADIERFSQGDKELEDKYFDASDGMAPATAEVIRRFIRDYVNANGLTVAAYQDPYWPPVPLEDAAAMAYLTMKLTFGASSGDIRQVAYVHVVVPAEVIVRGGGSGDPELDPHDLDVRGAEGELLVIPAQLVRDVEDFLVLLAFLVVDADLEALHPGVLRVGVVVQQVAVADADLGRFTPGSPWGLGNADNAINHYRRIMEWAHINVTLPDDARILRCDGSLSYVISIVEANGNRYLFCERI